LAEALLALTPDRQAAEIDRLREQKGTDNTVALATAIPYLSPEPRRKAREALADRVARMKPENIRVYMQDEVPEIRRAAALACAIKGAKQLVPQLIALLTDRETGVARAAYAALKDMTGQDFGPAANADDADRKRAASAWTNWWKNQSP
jgi:HEAT repeat protein